MLTPSCSQGRKIGKEKCVDKPNTQEVFEAAKLIGLRTVAEPEKAYCRDYWVRGRVKVCLFDADGSALNADIPNSEFMAHAGARIHALSDMRTARKGRTLYAKVAAQIPKCREKGKSAQNKGSSAGNKAGGSKKKKKGKR